MNFKFRRRYAKKVSFFTKKYILPKCRLAETMNKFVPSMQSKVKNNPHCSKSGAFKFVLALHI